MCSNALHLDFGKIVIELSGAQIVSVRIADFDADIIKPHLPNEVGRNIFVLFYEYFHNNAVDFSNLPVSLEGYSVSEQAILMYLFKNVGYGKRITYGELALACGHPRAYRWVGAVLHKNRIAIVIPCHRVVCANGIGGFSYGIPIKKRLLALERRFKE